MGKNEVRRDLEPDGKVHAYGDAIEANPDFHDEYHDMSEEFFKENNPGYYALLQRLKNGTDKETD